MDFAQLLTCRGGKLDKLQLTYVIKGHNLLKKNFGKKTNNANL